ncbi:MAG: protein phosphatase CheZ [Rhodospirillales bacterium]|nr:protein phosphatase CheZ [Rhodospirillales bacterium]
MADPYQGPAVIPQAILAERLAAIRQRYPEAEPEAVAEIVRAVVSSMRGDLSAQETSLLSEIEELGRTIASAKAEIAALRVDDITGSDIPFATDELDAIVAHTAAATEAILETCETLDQVASDLNGPAAAQLQDATTRIYEACSFQDITGQRITKVVTTLKAIEAKVAHIVAAFGRPEGAPIVTPERELAAAGLDEAALLNGPQLPAAAMDQSDIDRLLASFD